MTDDSRGSSADLAAGAAGAARFDHGHLPARRAATRRTSATRTERSGGPAAPRQGPVTLRVAARPADARGGRRRPGDRARPGSSTGCRGCSATRTTRAAFEPHHEVLRQAARRHGGWRVPRSGLVLESLAPAAIEQLVTGQEAFRGWRLLLLRHGELAPGPGAERGMRVPPTRRRSGGRCRPGPGCRPVSTPSARPSSSGPRPSPAGWRRRSAGSGPEAERVSCARCRASGSGRRPRCGSERTATPMR